jgi:hypothetical protein
VSDEVVVVGLCLAAAVATMLAPLRPDVANLARAVLGLTAAAVLVSLGQVYRLGGQCSWRGAAPVSPLVLGLAFGAVFLLATGGLERGRSGLCLGLLGLDAAVSAVRVGTTLRSGPCSPVFPALHARGPALLAARLMLVNGLPALALVGGSAAAALGVLALGLIVDRIGFYGLAAQRTTEAELRRVEAVIEAQQRTPS